MVIHKLLSSRRTVAFFDASARELLGRPMPGTVEAVASRVPHLPRRRTAPRLNWRGTVVKFLANAVLVGLLILLLPGFDSAGVGLVVVVINAILLALLGLTSVLEIKVSSRSW
jgi:hypothetical protein